MIYDTLRKTLRLMASNQSEYDLFVELVTMHFEGKITIHELPDSVKLALAEWERENIEDACIDC